jgi:hypothetical protein
MLIKILRNVVLSLYNTAEIKTLVLAGLEKIKAAFSDNVSAQPLIRTVEKRLEQLEAVLGSKTGAISEKLRELDSNRYSLFLAFRSFVVGYSRRKADDTKNDAAKALLAIIRSQGYSLYKGGQKQMSSILNSLFAVLDQAENVERIVLLGLTEVYDDLKKAESTFVNAMGDKAAQLALLEALPKARRGLIDSFADLLADVALKAQAEPEKYGPVSAGIEELIDGVNAGARARKTRRTNRNAEPGETPSPTVQTAGAATLRPVALVASA